MLIQFLFYRLTRFVQRNHLSIVAKDILNWALMYVYSEVPAIKALFIFL